MEPHSSSRRQALGGVFKGQSVHQMHEQGAASWSLAQSTLGTKAV
jgi:hypothetical protein